MAKIQICLGPSSSQRSHGSGEKKKFGISTFFARVPGQNVSLPPNLPRNMALLRRFLVRWTLNPHNFGQNGRNVDFFCPSPSHRDDGSRGGKVFTILTLFARVAGHTARLPSTKLPFWAFATASFERNWNSPWILEVNEEVEQNSLQRPFRYTHHKFPSRPQFYPHLAPRSKLQIAIWFMDDNMRRRWHERGNM